MTGFCGNNERGRIICTPCREKCAEWLELFYVTGKKGKYLAQA